MSSTATVVVVTVLGTLIKKAIAVPFDLSKRKGSSSGGRSFRGGSGGAGIGGGESSDVCLFL